MLAATMIAIRTLISMTVLTGILYPLLVYGIGSVFFKTEANGSLLARQGQVVGSELIAQKFASDRYFHSRPSAVDYGTVPSGASNLGPTSAALKEAIDKRRSQYGANAPTDLITASGSGLDPHLSPDAVIYQIDRVATARGFNDQKKQKLRNAINSLTEEPQLGFLGDRTVNVLKLNLALDELTNEP